MLRRTGDCCCSIGFFGCAKHKSMLKKLRSRISTTKTSESILEALEIKMMFLLRKCPDLAKPARLLLWLAAISMTAVFAANWEPMNVVDLPDTSGKKFYVTFMDRSSLQKTGNLRSIWILTNYLEVQSFRGIKDGEVDFIKYRSAKSLVY